MKQKSPGYTFIELMITVAILAIISATISVNVGDMFEKTKEGGTRGNIGLIMAAISVYYGDSNGLFPNDITAQTFKTYLDIIPSVQITHPKSGFRLAGTVNTVLQVSTRIDLTIATNTDGWKYNKKTGNVWVNNSQTDTGGRQYSMYGYE